MDGDDATYTSGYDPDYLKQSTSTTVVMHLVAGQEIGVDPTFDGPIDGDTTKMYSSFGITLMYPD